MIPAMLPTALLIALPGAWFGHANPVSHVPGAAILFPAALFWIALKAPSPASAFRSGWICAAAAYAACLYWVFIPVHVHGGLPWILALPCPILLGMYLGLYGGAFSALIHWARPVLSPVFLGLSAGLLWGGLEMAQGTLFTGFSWLTLPAALAPWPAAIQGLAFVGEYWLSAVFVAAAAWLILARESTFGLLLGIATPLVLIGFGAVMLARPLPEGEPVRVTLVQGNIDQTMKWEPEYQEATVRAYLDLTAKELSSKPELVIWPETAMPFYLQEENALSGKCGISSAPRSVLPCSPVLHATK
jgi:apolipoprotein N-acyltransferase